MPEITPESSLTDDAKHLLVEASNDSSGAIMKIAHLGGTILQTNGKSILNDNSPREVARWKAALELLISNGLVEPIGYKGVIFKVTHNGYQIADRIKG